MSYTLEPIGVVHSCFSEKFAIPRQPQLAPAATGILELFPPYNQPEALVGLEHVSHLWLLFVFHAADSGPKHLRVRPPRLGGNQRIGVFASRATHRPNPLGQSVVKLEGIVDGMLLLSGIDLLDGTPVLDIKPYVPYADALPEARNDLAPAPPAPILVEWSALALTQADEHGERLRADLRGLIEQCLAQDPKPAYQQPEPSREYGGRFWDLNVRWHYPAADCIRVIDIQQVNLPD
ncbi:tRNA (N6-threonylcarbamoyladenosine(37)-N6)-methyltransferase TrmO [Pseudomonas sp. 5Ae-yellow]|uniref:tRNA (N6-threonylcarbamoyladenosine(37)-N6)-methyltransferase TrmO n=1 Tax=Pseudomonas sp. 5Ae-yellow TaxID=2759848 RepID=UPI0015F46DD0|nr:tRNA (N6-threonylcarbamoyladenosine(37)-N6)-methyltransferase TrmO [Pseudomonas sp. 5Ae-yellow]MBA6419439.1 tRNA (N6-threonylcarbamoyladenosine(37)-N6)-methyltransferase TrmO [Pseudomonas sp. 5Ae-yellow]|tara:strand:+ start:398 stop:1102 length:705 start_codon:yes stop_codon:yes gene_type:complete